MSTPSTILSVINTTSLRVSSPPDVTSAGVPESPLTGKITGGTAAPRLLLPACYKTGCRCRAGAGQVLGTQVACAGQTGCSCQAGAGQVPGRCWTGAGQVLGIQVAGAGQVLGRYWAGAGQVLGRCWTGAAGAGQTGLRSGTQAQRSRVLAL